MNDSQNKPTLEDLFVSKKLSNCQPDSWDDFEKKVKIKTLESYQKHNHSFYIKYFAPMIALILITVFSFQQHFITTDHSLNNVSSTEKEFSSSLQKVEEIPLTNDLESSEVLFSYNTYSSVSSHDYEKSFALENLDAHEQVSSYTSPTLALEESNSINSITNRSF